MNSRYASGKYRFEIRLSEEVPEGRKEVAQRFIAGNKRQSPAKSQRDDTTMRFHVPFHQQSSPLCF